VVALDEVAALDASQAEAIVVLGTLLEQ